MRTNKNFDYDLWTDENGIHYARVKRTGEICEVEQDVYDYLSLLNNQMTYQESKDTVEDKDGNRISRFVSLDSIAGVSDDGEEYSLYSTIPDPENPIDDLITKMDEKEFMKSLTKCQRKIYICLTRYGMNYAEIADKYGVSYQCIQNHISSIKKKYEIFSK